MMVVHTEKKAWRSEFLASVATTLNDSRLWFIVLPSLVLCGLALVFVKPWLAGVISFAVALVDAHLINRIESLPRPDGKELATSLYRTILLPATIGALVIASSDLLVSLWFMPWHWFHTSDDIPTCSYILGGILLGLLGIPVTAAVTALLSKERAVFATMVGLTVYIPLNLTDLLSGDQLTRSTSIIAKSCKLDLNSDDSSGAFADGLGLGIVSGVLTRVLVAIFVAKLVSAWLSRKSAPSS